MPVVDEINCYMQYTVQHEYKSAAKKCKQPAGLLNTKPSLLNSACGGKAQRRRFTHAHNWLQVKQVGVVFMSPTQKYVKQV